MQNLIVKYVTLLAIVAASRSESQVNASIVDIVAKYFEYHGVKCINLIICPEDIASPYQYDQLLLYTQSLILNGFYVQILHGNDYMDINETFKSPYPFSPPITFGNDNNTGQRLKLQLQPLKHKSGNILLQFSNGCAIKVLHWATASEHNFFTTNRFWLLLTTDMEHIQLLNDKRIFIPPDSEARILLYSVQKQSQSLQFDLIDIYKISSQTTLKQRYVCSSCRSSLEMLNALKIFGSAISYREDLEGITFNTALVIIFPDLFTGIEDLSLRHIDTISKANNRVTLELANKLNIRFNTYQTDNYGWRKPNGSFDGLMGRFQRYELDFAQMAIFMRLDRIAIVDFAAETYRVRAGVIFRQPPLSAVANIFAMPFENDVWIAILFLMIFIIMVFTLELFLSPHTLDMDFWDCVIFAWGAACQQGFYVTVGSKSARVIVFTTFVATLFLFTSFSANIVALLQSPSEAIHSLNDLIQSPLEIGVQDLLYNKIYFNESTDPVTNHLYRKKIAPKGDRAFMRAPIGIEKMRNGLFAYQVELQSGYQIISNTFSEPEKCGLKELEPFQLPILSVPTRKNFPYKELFRRQLRWQREVGLLDREERKWFPQKPKCEGGVSGFVSIGITECRYALAMFGFGIVAGFIMFIAERFLKRFVQYSRAQRIKKICNSPNVSIKCKSRPLC